MTPEIPPRLQPVTNLDQLTRRQREVAILVSKGLSNQQIADALYVTESTIRGTHLNALYKRTGLENRFKLGMWVWGELNNVPQAKAILTQSEKGDHGI